MLDIRVFDKLNFDFKGTRKYVQGPDIFNKIVDGLYSSGECDLDNIEIAIHGMVTGGLTLKSRNEYDDSPLVIFKYTSKFVKNELRFYDCIQERDEKKHPYDEELVTSRCAISGDEKSIKLQGESPYSLIETMVAMNKYLHLSLINKMGKWLFVRAQFDKWGTPTVESIEISIESTFKNKLTKSKVKVNDQEFGYLYFTLE